MSKLENDLFLRACRKEYVERTPIWIMRQAGRYLPEYRAVRAKNNFLTMCKTPELVAEVTLQPVDIIGVDAAILFSDILVIPEAMGMHLEMHEGKGPVFPNPIRSKSDITKLLNVDVSSALKYVLDAVALTKKELDSRVPLIGFSGSPWTLFTYMIEGSGSKNFSNVKNFIYSQPQLSHLLLDKITDVVSDYLSAKIENGVDAVQIFDTWGGILSPKDFREFSLCYIEKVISQIKRNLQPVITFSKGVHHSYKKIAGTGTNVVGLDWTIDIGKVRKKIGDKVALQGNLDPAVLYGKPEFIKEKVKEVLKSYGKGNGHIFNLGHGILPNVSPQNTKTFVEFVKTESLRYHRK